MINIFSVPHKVATSLLRSPSFSFFSLFRSCSRIRFFNDSACLCRSISHHDVRSRCFNVEDPQYLDISISCNPTVYIRNTLHSLMIWLTDSPYSSYKLPRGESKALLMYHVVYKNIYLFLMLGLGQYILPLQVIVWAMTWSGNVLSFISLMYYHAFFSPSRLVLFRWFAFFNVSGLAVSSVLIITFVCYFQHCFLALLYI